MYPPRASGGRGSPPCGSRTGRTSEDRDLAERLAPYAQDGPRARRSPHAALRHRDGPLRLPLPPDGREPARPDPEPPSDRAREEESPLSLTALITMVLILGFVWGGLAVLLVTAVRKEREKEREGPRGAA